MVLFLRRQSFYADIMVGFSFKQCNLPVFFTKISVGILTSSRVLQSFVEYSIQQKNTSVYVCVFITVNTCKNIVVLCLFKEDQDE